MGKGLKTRRGMNVLIKKIKRKRQLKKAAHRSFTRPEGLGEVPQANSGAPAKKNQDNTNSQAETISEENTNAAE